MTGTGKPMGKPVGNPASEPVGQPRLALAMIRIASSLVPQPDRAEWRREWEAEVLGRWEELEAREDRDFRARVNLLWRAGGSLVDAMSYDHGRWRMEGLREDLRVATRSLVRRPGFSSVIILTLAIGIGANTALFSIARDVLLRPFPYPEAEKVVSVFGHYEGGVGFSGNVTYPNIADLEELSTTFEGIGVIRHWDPALEDDRGAVVIRGAMVTANYFTILGMEAGLGRFFLPGEQGSGRDRLVVLSYPFWMERFGGDRDIVGQDVRLNGSPYQVIGVTSKDFEDPWLWGGPGSEPQAWRTVASPPSEWPRSGRSWKGIGRVRSEVTLAAAQDEIAALFSGLAEEYQGDNAGRGMRAVPLRERIAGPSRRALLTLLGAVGVLLLIACSNLANLLLGRALDRQGEFAVHRALGASAWRILNRGMAEAALLAATGGVLGVVVAVGLGQLAVRLGPLLPRPASGEMDSTLLLFALAVSVGAGLLFGLMPSIHAARSSTATPGSTNGRGATATKRGHRIRGGLVVGQLALTATLMVGMVVLVKDLRDLGAVDLGMETDGVVAVQLHGSAWWELEAEVATAQWNDVLQSVGSLPNVAAAGAIDVVPLGGSYSCDGVQREDRPPPGPGEGACAEVRSVQPGIFAAMNIPLVRGRVLEDRDQADQPLVVVIDQNMADTFWPGEEPLGKRIGTHSDHYEVVGIVANMNHFGPGGDVRPMLYLNASQEGWNGATRGLSLIVRGADTSSLVESIRGAVAAVSPAIAIGEIHTLNDLLATNLAAPRFRAGIMSAFGLTGLMLALLGVAGVMNYSVSRRTREIGVRLAVGADPNHISALVMREGVHLVRYGVGFGLLAAIGIAGAIQALLFEVSAREPLVYLVVGVVLTVAALLACYVPARRASRIDPLRALSRE